MTAQFEWVQVSRAGPVATVAMHRPQKRNAMSVQLLTELRDALREQQQSDEVASVVLTGSGSVFSSGADRSAVAGLSGDALTRAFAPIALQMADLISEVVFQLVSMSKPVIAAVNGHAAGGAMIIALGCDFRVVSDEAMFWMPEIGMGRAIGEPSMETLLELVGQAVTKDIVVTGRRLPAAEMATLQLVNRIVPRDDVMAAAQEWAQSLAALDRQAMTTIKTRANAALFKIWERALPR